MSVRHTAAVWFIVLATVIAALLFAATRVDAPDITALPQEIAVSTSTPQESGFAPSPATSTATTSPERAAVANSQPSTTPKAKKASIQATKSTSAPAVASSSNEITRIDNAYPTPPFPFESVNTMTRGALVNILCATKSIGSMKPISGSGIIVDSRGTVLTNAHVAQYVPLSQSGRTDLSCTVRSGAPARARWIPVVMYIPTVWVDAHAGEILSDHAIGTGEHDYALLYIAADLDGNAVDGQFAAVVPDAREAIGFPDDAAMTASYPVEFIGGNVIQGDLFPVTSITTIRRLMTFGVGSADALSLGGVMSAQNGSSGGGVVNQWNRLIGLITTTSAGATTAERDLHAITTAYISRDMKTQSGRTLAETLALDPKVMADAFRPNAAELAQKLITTIKNR